MKLTHGLVVVHVVSLETGVEDVVCGFSDETCDAISVEVARGGDSNGAEAKAMVKRLTQ
jgi:hypothetical protein